VLDVNCDDEGRSTRLLDVEPVQRSAYFGVGAVPLIESFRPLPAVGQLPVAAAALLLTIPLEPRQGGRRADYRLDG
jgi:hypothetical protein